jgi:two-component system CheB/CheR fusion protein
LTGGSACPTRRPRAGCFPEGNRYWGKDGKLTHYIGIVVDISVRKRAEVALQAHRNELENQVRQRTIELSTLYNQAPCGYHSLDRNGTFVNINDTELRWLGYEREEIIGRKTALDIMSPACHESFPDQFPETAEERRDKRA